MKHSIKFLAYGLSMLLSSHFNASASEKPDKDTTARHYNQAAGLLHRIGRGIVVDAPRGSLSLVALCEVEPVPRSFNVGGSASSLATLLHNSDIVTTIADYCPVYEPKNAGLKANTLVKHGIINPHNFCYLISAAHVAWAVQRSLHKQNKLPISIGKGGSDVCTLLTSALQAHTKKGLHSKYSSPTLLEPLINWLQKHARHVYGYEVSPDQILTKDTTGFSYEVLELYLKHLNEHYTGIGQLAPCPSTQLFDGTNHYNGSGQYKGPRVEFMPIFDAQEEQSECEEGILNALKALPDYPLVLRMVPVKFLRATKTTALPITITTGQADVTYLLRGVLLHDYARSHTSAMLREDTAPRHQWWEYDNEHCVRCAAEWEELADTYNTVIVEGVLPTDLIYERQDQSPA